MADKYAIFSLLEGNCHKIEGALKRNQSRQVIFNSLVSLFKKKKRRIKVRISNYIETIVIPQYIDEDFQERFRLERRTFYNLLQELSTDLLYGSNKLPLVIDPEKQLLIFLKYCATQYSLQTLADLFDVGESTVFKIVRKVSQLLCTKEMKKVIKWPSNAEQVKTEREFKDLKGFPGIIGAIDGTHIAIRTPKQHPENYFNRKCYPSVILQAVCDANMHFVNIYCGWPGSVHDARVLKNSPLYSNANNEEYFAPNTHLVGDAAYPIQHWLLTPYKDTGHLNLMKRNYNYVHSSSRMVIEKAFGLLKGRFRRLKYIDMLDIEAIVKVVISCCVLHEFCLQNNDVLSDNVDMEEEVNNYQNILQQNRQAEQKRDRIAEALVQH